MRLAQHSLSAMGWIVNNFNRARSQRSALEAFSQLRRSQNGSCTGTCGVPMQESRMMSHGDIAARQI
jgi:hypothetical protein